MRLAARLGLLAACAALILPALAIAKAPSRTLYMGADRGSVAALGIDRSGSLSPLRNSPFAAAPGTAGLAMTPTGHLLFAVNTESDTVSVYAVSPGGGLRAVGPPTPTGTHPVGIATAGHGRRIYVANAYSSDVSAFAVDDAGALTPIPGSPFRTGFSPAGLAVQNHSSHLYVANSGLGTISAYSIALDGTLAEIWGSPFAAGTPRAIAMNPKSTRLFASDPHENTIHDFDVGPDGALSATSAPTGVRDLPGGLAVTPDGRTLYVAIGGANAVEGMRIRPGRPLRPAPGSPYRTGINRPAALSVAPDGDRIYAAGGGSQRIYEFGIGKRGRLERAKGSPHDAGAFGAGEFSTVITPELAPTAKLRVGRRGGGRFVLDASRSSDPDGRVARYEWDFGDGRTRRTTGPRTVVRYRRPGEHTATVTVTDDAGCSADFVFTGQTAYCDGGPQAVAEVSFRAGA